MNVKTSELIGAALDWAVTQCRFPENADSVWRNFGAECAYSTDWSQGGLIIESEQIDIEHTNATPTLCFAKLLGDEPYGASRMRGGTPLIAAMRCYIASKLGEEVEIPDALMPSS